MEYRNFFENFKFINIANFFCEVDYKIKLQFLNINKNSNYECLLNVTALILRFIINLNYTNVCDN